MKESLTPTILGGPRFYPEKFVWVGGGGGVGLISRNNPTQKLDELSYK